MNIRHQIKTRRITAVIGLLTAATTVCAACTATAATSPPVFSALPAAATRSYIVEASNDAAAAAIVRSVGGVVLSALPIIDAVGAQLSDVQVSMLRSLSGVHVFQNRSVATEGSKSDNSNSDSSNSDNSNSNSAQSDGSKSKKGNSAAAAPAASTPSTSLTTTPTTVPSGAAALLNQVVDAYSSSVLLASGSSPQIASFLYETNYPMLVGADILQAAGVTGQGVTIAVLDTGLWQNALDDWNTRVLASVDFVNLANGQAFTGDANGHGTHITSIAASGRRNIAGDYYGIAPKANIVVARAFGSDGSASYLDVIESLNWIVANRKKYNIRVINLSFGAPPVSNYWDDPLNQAVMKAWKAGIVVVASAGNSGPTQMTIGVPGNLPYVITTGAMTDNFTPYDATDDKLASFSSTGPTVEGFVKPDVVAPGGHMVASMPANGYLVQLFGAQMQPNQSLFTMSGTSQAAAVTTGVVALMLQAQPSLSPDEVKCKLMSAARPAVNGVGKLAYSVFQQGAGLINAVSAINSAATHCANVGLDVAADLSGAAHFGGPANMDANGNYYLMDMRGSTWGKAVPGDGLSWSRSYDGTRGYSWSQGYVWSGGYVWSSGYVWDQGYVWSIGNAWAEGYVWNNSLTWTPGTFSSYGVAQPMSVDPWVNQE